jgi:hypothetical protein
VTWFLENVTRRDENATLSDDGVILSDDDAILSDDDVIFSCVRGALAREHRACVDIQLGRQRVTEPPRVDFPQLRSQAAEWRQGGRS